MMKIPSALKPLTLALMLSLLAFNALAEWQWIDSEGRKVFSDRSPPPGTPDKNIIKWPVPALALSREPAAPAADSGAAPSPPVAVPAAVSKVSGKDPQLEARKKQAEDEADGKKKADEEKAAKAKAENCDSAKRYLATLDSGMRIASTNAKGEREILDDSQRADAKKRTQGIAQSNCK